VNRANTLKSLEIVLESFLDRAVALKEKRLGVLNGINRLDDIARDVRSGQDLTDEIGGWFASHSNWLSEDSLRAADRSRIGDILGAIKSELRVSPEQSPATNKIAREIDRWDETIKGSSPKLVLKRGPETTAVPAIEPAVEAAPRTATEIPADVDTITLFDNTLERLLGLFRDLSVTKVHVLTILDDALRSADMQLNRDALLLSAFIIYYLRQNGYKVEPYVQRLKKAEALQKASERHAESF
jgi:hypothetical protein